MSSGKTTTSPVAADSIGMSSGSSDASAEIVVAARDVDSAIIGGGLLSGGSDSISDVSINGGSCVSGMSVGALGSASTEINGGPPSDVRMSSGGSGGGALSDVGISSPMLPVVSSTVIGTGILAVTSPSNGIGIFGGAGTAAATALPSVDDNVPNLRLCISASN